MAVCSVIPVAGIVPRTIRCISALLGDHYCKYLVCYDVQFLGWEDQSVRIESFLQVCHEMRNHRRARDSHTNHFVYRLADFGMRTSEYFVVDIYGDF